MFLNNGYLAFSVVPAGALGANAAVWRSTTTKLDTDQWFHIAVVMDRATNTPIFYVNGQIEPISVTTGTLGAVSISSSAPLNVGGFNFANSDTRGLIDELEIFNAALPQASINLIYRALTLGKCNRNDLGCIPPPPGMVSWYPFTPITSQAHLDDHATTNSALNRFGLRAEVMLREIGSGLQVTCAGSKLHCRTDGTRGEGRRTSSLNAITTAGAWRHLTITADRVDAPLMYFDGLLDNHFAHGVGRHRDLHRRQSGQSAELWRQWLLQARSPSAGDYAFATNVSNYKLSIGSGQYAWTGEVDEVELFDRVLTDAEVLGIYTADTAGKCASSGIGVPIPTRVPVTVNTNLNPTQGITVGITSLVTTPNTSLDVYTNQSVPIGIQVVSAQPDKKIDPSNANIQWTFINWSLNNVPNVTWTNALAQPVSVPAFAAGTTYTANYNPWGFVTVVNNGCAAVNLTTGY